jgi:hypothetical protein
MKIFKNNYIRKMQIYNIGIYTDTDEKPKGFDIYFNYLKDISGNIHKPVKNSHNIISCFADNKTVNKFPNRAAFSGKHRATPSQDKTLYCNWICPSDEEYKSFLLQLIQNTDKSDVAGIHLDSVSLPGPDYCRCENCLKNMKLKKMGLEKFHTCQINNFIRQVSEITVKPLSLTLYPDPFEPQRYGLDITELSKYIDFFLVPLYDISYKTLYWIDILANAFAKKISIPFYIMLYAKDVKIENLKNAAAVVMKYTKNIILSYDNNKAVEINNFIKNFINEQ